MNHVKTSEKEQLLQELHNLSKRKELHLIENGLAILPCHSTKNEVG